MSCPFCDMPCDVFRGRDLHGAYTAVRCPHCSPLPLGSLPSFCGRTVVPGEMPPPLSGELDCDRWMREVVEHAGPSDSAVAMLWLTFQCAILVGRTVESARRRERLLSDLVTGLRAGLISLHERGGGT